jgi:hypothetical protein
MEGGGASAMEKAAAVSAVADLEGEKAEVEESVAVGCAAVGGEEVVHQADLVEGVVDEVEPRLDGDMQLMKNSDEVAAAEPSGEEAVGKAAVVEQAVGEKEVGKKRIREEDVTEIAVAEQVIFPLFV